MRRLMLGGTVFLGRHLAEAALARGHVVTLFNRGQHNPELFPAVEKLRGDRSGAAGRVEDGPAVAVMPCDLCWPSGRPYTRTAALTVAAVLSCCLP
jgi:2'-hydroxyisoflavone reductase